MDFDEAARELGFHPRQQGSAGGGGVRTLEAQPNPYMTYVVQVYPDGNALFTWEFALGEYLAIQGIQMGSDETLNQFIFPRTDVRGPADAAWLAATIEQTETMLETIRLDRPSAAEPA
jgi:hypothetical protein